MRTTRLSATLVLAVMALYFLSVPSSASVIGPPPITPCDAAVPSMTVLWPPNHKFVQVHVNGVADDNGDPMSIVIYSVFQDEPVNGTGDGDTAPDAVANMDGSVKLRAERSGTGDGRVYYVNFSAYDINGGMCVGIVTVCVPHDRGKGASACGDGGALYDSFSQ